MKVLSHCMEIKRNLIPWPKNGEVKAARDEEVAEMFMRLHTSEDISKEVRR